MVLKGCLATKVLRSKLLATEGLATITVTSTIHGWILSLDPLS